MKKGKEKKKRKKRKRGENTLCSLTTSEPGDALRGPPLVCTGVANPFVEEIGMGLEEGMGLVNV